MAKKITKPTPPNVIRKCSTCAFAHLVQYFNNPVLAECPLRDKGDRQVANCINGCPFYMGSTHLPLTIERRNSYAIQ